MITDEMLKLAAMRSSEILVKYYEQDFDPEQQHKFSPNFEKKMKRLCRRANHPILYRSMQYVASMLLAIFIGGVVWLSVDIEARATFFGWVREIYETYIVYRFEGKGINSVKSNEYRPTWLPDGYVESYFEDTADTKLVTYVDNTGDKISFIYASNSDDISWFLEKSHTTIKSVNVDGIPAELFLTDNSEVANAIVWIDYDNTAFLVSAFLDEYTLIKIAESVKK